MVLSCKREVHGKQFEKKSIAVCKIKWYRITLARRSQCIRKLQCPCQLLHHKTGEGRVARYCHIKGAEWDKFTFCWDGIRRVRCMFKELHFILCHLTWGTTRHWQLPLDSPLKQQETRRLTRVKYPLSPRLVTPLNGDILKFDPHESSTCMVTNCKLKIFTTLSLSIIETSSSLTQE